MVIALFHSMVTAGTPILFAALGEILTERSGILNLGVEGVMLIGALCGFAAASNFSNPWLGLLAAICGGALAGLLFGILCIGFQVDQAIAGIALTTFGIGFSGFLGKPLLGKLLTNSFKDFSLPVLGNIPILGKIFFTHDALVYISYLLVPLMWYFIFRMRPGLHLRSVGENPRAADTLGINVIRTRYIYTMLGCILGAIGGAYITLAYVPTWLEHITAGRGWIAVSLVIFAGWNPLLAMLGSYLFGGIDAATLYIQAAGTNIPSNLLGMAPYIITILTLIVATLVRRGGQGPAALARPYNSEEQ
jgi:general nucleoside transport system permease protein